MRDIDDICIWKLTANTTSKDIREEHKFYKCVVGDGKKYCCPDYVSMNSIKEKEQEDYHG